MNEIEPLWFVSPTIETGKVSLGIRVILNGKQEVRRRYDISGYAGKESNEPKNVREAFVRS
ncbi:hypothetical protein PCCS19_34140 [Paenibacillus sp. CCS19]|nr:hypothetical protein PCCS19_34140 [Paenibacillus cellulosilyticus]